MNEEQTIRRSVEPLLTDPAVSDIEVLIAVGPSTDRTRDVVLELAEEDRRVRLIDNPLRISAEGLNAAIRASRGDVVLRMDGHAEPDAGYLSACLDVLASSGAWNVGGRIQKVGRTRAARAAAAATSSPFGIGGGPRYHLLDEPRDVDTLWPGCWPRWVFERIGMFDPEMIQNQDDEFNQRILDAGGRIRFDPSISVTYFSRGTWRGLLRQYFRYGMFKVRGLQKRPHLLRIRHLAPAALIAVLVIGAAAALVTPVGPAIVGVVVVSWLVAAGWFGRRVSAGYGSALGDVIAAYACLHAGYGLGMWVGAIRYVPRWFVDRTPPAPRLAPRDADPGGEPDLRDPAHTPEMP